MKNINNEVKVGESERMQKNHDKILNLHNQKEAVISKLSTIADMDYVYVRGYISRYASNMDDIISSVRQGRNIDAILERQQEILNEFVDEKHSSDEIAKLFTAHIAVGKNLEKLLQDTADMENKFVAQTERKNWETKHKYKSVKIGCRFCKKCNTDDNLRLYCDSMPEKDHYVSSDKVCNDFKPRDKDSQIQEFID